MSFIPPNAIDLGLKCKVQVVSIDEDSVIDGKERIKTGDLITKVSNSFMI